MEIADPILVLVERVEQLAVDVELPLTPRSVADPDGRGIAPAPQVGELTLGQVVLAPDAVHDLERVGLTGTATRRRGHERHELAHLVRARPDVQSLEREARVADPAVAVIPVALAADRLGQRGRRRGDDGSRRPVGQPLQDAGTEPHQLAMRAVVGRVLPLPGAPRGNGVVEARRHVTGSGRLGCLPHLGRYPPNREPDGLACGHGERRGHRRAGDRHRNPGAHRQLVRSAEGPSSVDGAAEERPDQTELGAGEQFHVERHRSRDPLDRPAELAGRVESDVVAALALGEHQGVTEADDAAVGLEGGLEHQRSIEVATLAREPAGRRDRPVAGVWVQDAGEHRRAVEARQAEPVDRTVACDERGRVAVRQQPVVGDRLGGPGRGSRMGQDAHSDDQGSRKSANSVSPPSTKIVWPVM